MEPVVAYISTLIKLKFFLPKKDPQSRLTGVLPPNIAPPMHGVKLLGGAAIVDFDFCNELSVLSLLLDLDLETGNGGLPSYPLHLEGLVSILQEIFWTYFDDAFYVFNTSMETDLLSNRSEIVAPKLMKKMADIYFTRVTKNAESTFSLSRRQVALWKFQREDHTSDWLRTVPISGLGQTMNGKTYRCVWCYWLGIPLFSMLKPCLACSRVFAGDIYGDHAITCAGIIGIKHHHNVVRDTLVDICYRLGILAGKEVDIGLDGRCAKPLRPADILLYSWDGGLDVCVDLTGSSALTQTGMVDFVPDRAVIDDAQRKRDKYIDKCAAIGYGFLPFSFSSLGELEVECVFLAQTDPESSRMNVRNYQARAAFSYFNRIGFCYPLKELSQIKPRINDDDDVLGVLSLELSHETNQGAHDARETPATRHSFPAARMATNEPPAARLAL
ncbi:hypothetical protein Tco_1123047 [Tanacetum coccineum]|uniref:Uncharacterized protein n=1 Tax=Tanacetum coccineum TaxID=301880 RepID=A0ABQ5J526_9ASTR